MSRWSSRCILLAIVALPATPSPGQSPPPEPAAAPEPAAPDDPWEERKARAREDVEFLEVLQKAKQAEVREGDLRVAASVAWKVEQDRQKKAGLLVPFQIRQAEIFLAEAQTQLELRRVEAKDVDIRLARSRRRLKAVELSASALEPEGDRAEERLRELEIKYDRLRSEFERIKRISDFKKNNP